MLSSHRLGDISNSQLQATLDRFDLGRLGSAAVIPFGLFGQNLYLTSTQGEFVFRGAPHYAWQLPTERFFAERLRQETTVPVPWPYFLEPESGPFPWTWGYAIMPRMPGLALADANVYTALSAQQRLRLAEAQGIMLAELQQAASSTAGSYDIRTGTVRPFDAGYVTRTVERACASAAQAFANGAHDTDDAAWLEATLDAFGALPEPARYSVVHEDFNRNNMTAAFGGDQVEITGLFDLMTCHYGDGLADLARQFCMFVQDDGGAELARAFVRAYLARREPLGPADIQRSLLYLADERLLIWEYCHRPGHDCRDWGVTGSLRHWLGHYLDAMESVLTEPGV